MYIPTYVHTYIHTHYTSISVHMYMCIYIYIHIFTHIYTINICTYIPMALAVEQLRRGSKLHIYISKEGRSEKPRVLVGVYMPTHIHRPS